MPPPAMPHGCHHCNCQKTIGSCCPGNCLNGECRGVFNTSESIFEQDDFYGPLIIVAGEKANFGGPDEFANAVLEAPLTVTNQTGAVPSWVLFEWRGHKYEFFPKNGTKGNQNNYTLPQIDGRAIDVSPNFDYSGPHLNAALGSHLVEVKYGNYVLEYDFSDDSVRRK